ncbi:MAG: S8 family serine peptidase, partial [Bacteroidia bacterium]|nr:S8 family serine peptidase [Bacteroidia bacterium]
MKVKKLLFTVFLCTLTGGYFCAQAQVEFSPFANYLLRKIERRAAKNDKAFGLSNKEIKIFGIKEKQGTYWVSGLIQVTSALQESTLKALGIQVRTKAGDVWSVDIPLNSFSAFKQLSGVSFFQMDENSFRPLLDKARNATRVDLVHQGFNLPAKYLGKGVIIGIIDHGFDFLHPTFWDTSGKRYRVVSYWNHGAESGTPPQGYDYGAEYTSPEQIRSLPPAQESHGVHVAGIAAGSGYGSGAAFRGIAPEADIIAVDVTLESESQVVDAVDYVVKKARALGRPCVVNLSFGGLNGAMDGNSLMEKGIENIVNQGRGIIAVAGAGNSGDIPCHLSKTFNNDEVTTIPYFFPVPEEKQRVLIWGEEGKNFEIKLELLDVEGKTLQRFPILQTSSTTPLDTFALVEKDTIHIYAEANPRAAINNRPYIAIDILYNVPINNPLDFLLKLRFFKLTIRAVQGSIHAWNLGISGQGEAFGNTLLGENTIPNAVEGDTTHTVLIPGTSKGVITVGAYTTKNVYKDYTDTLRKIQEMAEIGAIAPFSSIGPTLDGRIKPDIAAPGNVIASAVSRGDLFIPDSLIVKLDVINRDTAKYAVFEGTSIATPVVSGIVALLLQANPNLNFNQVKNIITTTTIKDNFTKQVPNTTWGWG